MLKVMAMSSRDFKIKTRGTLVEEGGKGEIWQKTENERQSVFTMLV